MSKNSKHKKLRSAELKRAVDELGEVRVSLDDAYQKFDSVTDPSVMDACILEITALRSKYNCAVRNIKSFYL